MRFRAALLLSAVLTAGAAFALDTVPVRMSFGTWGYDTGGQNKTVKPGDDFNAFANGGFLDTLAIPADRSSYGVDAILSEEAQLQLRAILEDTAAPADAAADAAKARGLYSAFMDQARVDALGGRPLSPGLDAIRAAKTRGDLAAVMGGGALNFQASLFDVSIETDAKAPDRYAVIVSQNGLGLPDRDYYLKPGFAKQ